MKKIVFLIILIILIFSGFILIKSKKDEQNNESKAFVHIYKPLEEEQKNINNYESFSAKLEALEVSLISTKVSGYIKKIYFKENQEVKKGDVLLDIDDLEYKHNILQLQYSIKALKSSIDSLNLSLNSLNLDMLLSKKEYETNNKIYKIGGVSKDKLDLSKIVYEQKKAKYNSTKKSIESKNNELNSQKEFLKSKESLKEYYNLKSPINGYVQEKILEVGDLAVLGKAIISLVSKEQKLSFLFASDNIKKSQEVFVNNKKIGVIEYISISAKNYLKEANIKLDKPLDYPINSLISIEVKIND